MSAGKWLWESAGVSSLSDLAGGVKYPGHVVPTTGS